MNKSSPTLTKKANKANGMIAVIKKSFTKVMKQVFLNIYKCLIRPHLEFANLIWHPRLTKHQKILENVKRRATRLVSGIKNLSYYERLKELNLCNIRLLQSHMRFKKNRPYNHWLKGQGHHLLFFYLKNGRSQFGSFVT